MTYGKVAKVLELGCGTGSMWKNHIDLISKCEEVILTDFSEGILDKFFTDVKILEYEDSLRVTVIDDLIDYVYSLSSMTDIANVERDSMKRIFEQNMIDGVLEVPKEYGMFVCENPV